MSVSSVIYNLVNTGVYQYPVLVSGAM